MSQVPVQSLSAQEHAQLCCTYAALILHDDNMEINDNQMQKLIKASGNKVDGFWAKLFAKALAGQNVNDLLMSSGGSNNGPVAQADGNNNQTQQNEPKKEEKVEEEEEDLDMGGLFD